MLDPLGGSVSETNFDAARSSRLGTPRMPSSTSFLGSGAPSPGTSPARRTSVSHRGIIFSSFAGDGDSRVIFSPPGNVTIGSGPSGGTTTAWWSNDLFHRRLSRLSSAVSLLALDRPEGAQVVEAVEPDLAEEPVARRRRQQLHDALDVVAVDVGDHQQLHAVGLAAQSLDPPAQLRHHRRLRLAGPASMTTWCRSPSAP